MLRRRIEKLERLRPRSAAELIQHLERIAVASLSPEDGILFAESQIPRHRGRPAPATEEVHQRYQEAIARLLIDVSLEELDSMLAFCGATPGAFLPGAEL